MADIDDCEESFSYLVETAAGQIRAGSDVDLAHHAVETSQRLLAICALLGRADVEMFVERLDRSGTARLRLLGLVAAGQTCEPRIATASRSLGFFAALASRNFKLAAEIAALLPRQHSPAWEYEEDFLFADCVREMVLAIESGTPSRHLAVAIGRWQQVLDGRESPTFEVCRALFAMDAPLFGESFAGFVASRVAMLEEYRSEVNFDAQVFAAEGNVYIEGIALLAIAVRLGFPVEVEYPLIPSLVHSAHSRRSGASPDWLVA
jgi:hypothetical protein